MFFGFKYLTVLKLNAFWPVVSKRPCLSYLLFSKKLILLEVLGDCISIYIQGVGKVVCFFCSPMFYELSIETLSLISMLGYFFT